jgi:Transposase
MRVKKSVSKNSTSLSVIKSVRINGKNTSKVVEALGSLEEIIIKSNGMDPFEWAKNRAKELTDLESKKESDTLVKFSVSKLLDYDNPTLFNCGYLFIQKLYYLLNIDKLCFDISKNYKFDYDLNSILSSLVYSRIIYPASKLSTLKLSKNFLEQSKFDLHHIYRALDVLAENSFDIQTHLYNASKDIVDRNSSILYYDCTNYFFEIEEASGLKQYGKSKENRPNPIVQMGLFLDGNGIPLAFNINPGNTNEQTTLQPLEKQIIKDFELSKLVVCTDAGLSSNSNKKFNSIANRAYITTQSLKKLKNHLRDWALDPSGFKVSGSSKVINIFEDELDYHKTYYKERWINENGLEERLIVSYSPKYQQYQSNIREKQIDRAIKKISNGKRKTKNPNDFDRFIKECNVTAEGEVAQTSILSLDEEAIEKESQYDGFYAMVTNLEDDINDIIYVNQRRWEIEETFRIMKSEFKARPVYLQKDNRIEAHFLICFISMVIFRILEKQLDEKYSAEKIIEKLKEMNVYKIPGEGYIPVYTRDEISDKLHEISEFRTDYQIVKDKKAKEIIKKIKGKK